VVALDRAQDSACKRSWRNFLSAGSDGRWKYLRKHAMVWSLNRIESQLYFTDPSCRCQLLLKMEDATQQLQLIVSSLPVYEKGVTNIENIKMYSLRLSDNLSVTELSSSQFVQTLILDYTPKLKVLGDYERLRILKLNGECPNLVSIGEMKNLFDLTLIASSTQMLSIFPLEKLGKLTLQNIKNLTDSFVSLGNRLQNLQELTISGSNMFRFLKEPSFIQIPSLRSLTVGNVHSIDLAGFPNLTSFTNSYGVSEIMGKDKSYPRLISFDGPFNEAEDYSQLHQLQKLKLHWNKSNEIKTFHIPENVTSVDMCLNILEFTSDTIDRKFDELKLFQSNIKCLSLFRNTIKVTLNSCNSLEDIEPLRNVQYLEISHCKRITNFSCLGSQQMLFLKGCSSLTNSDVENFTRVRTLMMSSCLAVTRLTNLMNNNLVLYNSTNLEEINLSGNNFVLVKLLDCQWVKSLTITGQVEELFVKDCPSLDMSHVANFMYFSSNLDFDFLFSF
jgi:hypothetical protein